MNKRRASAFLKKTILLPVGILLLLAGLGAVIVYGLVLQITCSRSDARTSCDSHTSFMGLIPIGTPHHQSDVIRADINESCTDTSEQYVCGHKVEVKSRDEIFPLNSHFFNQASAQELVGEINILKESPANGFMLKKNIQNRPMLVLGWLFVAAPLLILGCLLVYPAFSSKQKNNLPTTL
jgi:hypothetical protein